MDHLISGNGSDLAEIRTMQLDTSPNGTRRPQVLELRPHNDRGRRNDPHDSKSVMTANEWDG